jgi:hypothetical protein
MMPLNQGGAANALKRRNIFVQNPDAQVSEIQVNEDLWRVAQYEQRLVYGEQDENIARHAQQAAFFSGDRGDPAFGGPLQNGEGGPYHDGYSEDLGCASLENVHP